MRGPMMPDTNFAAERSSQRNAVIACFLGWTLDAFDFFVLTFVLAPIGKDFHKSIPEIALAITASLATRPIGAFIFGLLADRYGRRLPLMLDILFYSAIEVLSGFAPSYSLFIVLRLLYGIGMGGEWGVGASLTMESVPAKWRGILSGVLQEGYAFGYLLAAIAYWLVFPHFGWRAMFFIGGLPALLTLFIRSKVKESEAWKATSAYIDWGSYLRSIFRNWKRFAYLVLLMALMNFISHGTQDFYPTFLQSQRGYSHGATALITVLSMIGAMAGGILVGLYSDRRGRRRAMIGATLLAVALIPLWIAAPSLPLIVAGAFLMQFMVQGAWGVIPAHINELSPDTLRGFFPGFAYQLGVLFAASSAYLEALMGKRMSYGHAMGIFAAIVLIGGTIVIAFGPEAHGVAFGGMETEASPGPKNHP
ncbi:MAG TPA: MFS transporter [Candidatus Acidoferrales bacterium]|nr:MFS transporter [Candidatus Acidoferrales bacterium]